MGLCCAWLKADLPVTKNNAIMNISREVWNVLTR